MTVTNETGIWPANGDAPARPPGQGADTVPGDGSVSQITDIHDIKPALEIGYDGLWLIYLAAGIAVLLGLLALARWLWRRRKQPRAVNSTPLPIPPDKEAYAALDALAADKGLGPKQFYFRLSAVLRRYIERRFDFPAVEMTTEELLPHVDRISLDGSLAPELKAFCRRTDPIKFAGATVRQERLARDLAFSRNFVRETTEMPLVGENGDIQKAQGNSKDGEINGMI